MSLRPSIAPTLDTASLHLRRLVATDMDWLHALDTDPKVMRYISGGAPTPRDVFEQVHLPKLLQSHEAGPQFGFWAAVLKEMGQCIGWFHLRPAKQEPFDMELGYRLRHDVWGQGLATEGSLEFLRRGFTEWGLPRVVACTLAVNLPSRRVMEKCGMRWERDFICPPEWLHGWSEEQRRGVWYGINAAEFLAKPFVSE